MGKILSEMALDLPVSYDLTLFKMDRFNTQVDNWNDSMSWYVYGNMSCVTVPVYENF